MTDINLRNIKHTTGPILSAPPLSCNNLITFFPFFPKQKSNLPMLPKIKDMQLQEDIKYVKIYFIGLNKNFKYVPDISSISNKVKIDSRI